MHFKSYNWPLEKISKIEGDINPKPQYQRAEAWDDSKKSLLIDSILSGFDIPKIYLRHTKGIGDHDYEVADGQQRLRAIWAFMADKLPLVGLTGALAHLNDKVFSTLSAGDQDKLKQFELTVSVAYSASGEDIRELFRRLQYGVRLNSAEFRNSITSALGDSIRAMAESHPFCKVSQFSKARYKSDDLVAHAFAVQIYGSSRDMKAPDLKAMYFEYASEIDPAYAKKVNEILSFMRQMEKAIPGVIITKWGFVDLVAVLGKRSLTSLDATALATKYQKWEFDRKQSMSIQDELAQANEGTRKKQLFDYIQAFQKEGATKRNLAVRAQILENVLL